MTVSEEIEMVGNIGASVFIVFSLIYVFMTPNINSSHEDIQLYNKHGFFVYNRSRLFGFFY